MLYGLYRNGCYSQSAALPLFIKTTTSIGGENITNITIGDIAAIHSNLDQPAEK